MMQQYRTNSYLFGGNAPYVEEMYEAYLDNPGSVPDNWRDYFDALQHVPAANGSDSRDVAHAPVIESFAQRAKANAFAHKASEADLAVARKQVHVQSLIAAYRSLGSRWADLDPLKRTERPKIPELETAFYDLTEADMDITFSATNTYFTKSDSMTLREIVQALRETYCGTLGAEIMHITEPTEKRWWQERLESVRSKPSFSTEQKKHVLDRLTAAEGLERFLHTKYVGQKRFSLEGGESFIASMDELVQRAGEKGIQEIVIGMAHRGRLNVLVNTLGKMPKDLFAEFDHTAPEDLPAGDVKYHQGFKRKSGHESVAVSGAKGHCAQGSAAPAMVAARCDRGSWECAGALCLAHGGDLRRDRPMACRSAEQALTAQRLWPAPWRCAPGRQCPASAGAAQGRTRRTPESARRHLFLAPAW